MVALSQAVRAVAKADSSVVWPERKNKSQGIKKGRAVPVLFWSTYRDLESVSKATSPQFALVLVSTMRATCKRNIERSLSGLLVSYVLSIDQEVPVLGTDTETQINLAICLLDVERIVVSSHLEVISKVVV